MGENAAVLGVDLQTDFCEGGALPVPGGIRVVRRMNEYIYDATVRLHIPVYLSRCWHPEWTTHFDKHPPHCIRNTPGAAFYPELNVQGGFITRDEIKIVSKGMMEDEDAYDAFEGFMEDGRSFGNELEAANVGRLYIGGLALDKCVVATGLRALGFGLKVYVFKDAVAALDIAEGMAAMKDLIEAGAQFVTRIDEPLAR